ncbi:MAG: methylated-DNA--[protein]-cysteine S-methyltransferase [Clostridiales bacterium]|nr:methylated-DNA--[protein]-cysteine S-methyltransferase [Clostridiales bacterium]
MKYYCTIKTPVGTLIIVEENNALTNIDLLDEICMEELLNGGGQEKSTPLLDRAVNQLKDYFAGFLRDFDLPLAPKGTDFQKKDWAALCEVPYGETVTYKDIAVRIGCPKGPRAVGLANNRNPIMIVIPCHRVIGSDGSLVGYGGGLHIKEYLLKLEGVR